MLLKFSGFRSRKAVLTSKVITLSLPHRVPCRLRTERIAVFLDIETRLQIRRWPLSPPSALSTATDRFYHHSDSRQTTAAHPNCGTRSPWAEESTALGLLARGRCRRGLR